MAETGCKIFESHTYSNEVLNLSEVTLLNNNISKVHFEKGEHLIKQDTLSSHIFYLSKGIVKIHIQQEGLRDIILKIAPSPAFIGVSTVFGDGINQYSVTAIEPCQACCIDIPTFKNLILRNGRFATEIIANLCKDELCSIRNFVDQINKQVPGRLAGALIYFAEQVYKRAHFELPLSRSELADLIGTSRESATRNLHFLKEAGIIDLDRNNIRILKPDRLKILHQAG